MTKNTSTLVNTNSNESALTKNDVICSLAARDEVVVALDSGDKSVSNRVISVEPIALAPVIIELDSLLDIWNLRSELPSEIFVEYSEGVPLLDCWALR